MPTPPATTRSGLCGKRRNPFLVWLVWPLITLGVYHLVWWYKINREVRDYDHRIDVSPGVAVLALVPGFIIIFRRMFPFGRRVIESGLRRRRLTCPIDAIPGSA
jgi:hypothetical protein